MYFTFNTLVMKTQKTPLSFKILHWLNSFVFWVMTFFTIIVVIINLVLLTDIFTEPIQLRIEMPVPIEVVEDGTLHLENADLPVRIEEAYGKLYFVDTPIYVTRMVIKVMLIAILIGWFISWKFKRFTGNLRKGLLFEIDNINNLKHAAYGLTGLFLVSRIYMEGLKKYFEHQLEFDSIIIGGEAYNTDPIILFALLLWVLAHVFVKGIEMKKEQDLTI